MFDWSAPGRAALYLEGMTLIFMKVNIQKIEGSWKLGFVLDKHVDHSEFLGTDQFGNDQFDTVRTEVGEAIFQLKYRNDLSKIDVLSSVFVENLGEFFKTVGLVIPMPPSKNRTVQPLTLLAKAVAKKLDKPFFEKILVKNITTPLMKDLVTKEDKENALKGALSINDEITNDGKWDFLIIDDLYSSGTSLGVATDILKTYNKVNNIYVGAFSRTR